MSRIDRQMMEDLSVKTRFQVDVIEKVYRLAELLRKINEIPELNKNMVLKGGTAINFLYFDLPRVSIDIDLDYIGSVKQDRMKKDRTQIDTILPRLFKQLGYNVKSYKPYALLQYHLGYRNSAGNLDRIKAEINFFNRTPLFITEKRIFHNPFDINNFIVRTLRIEDLFGRKLRALMTRSTARDLYDVYQLFNNKISFENDVLRKCFIFYLCCSGDPRKIKIDILDEINESDIKANLLPLLRKGEKITAFEMKKIVTPVISEFLDFSESELEFITKMFDERFYDPNVLFTRLKYNSSVKQHPGILWRIKNL